MLLSGVRTEPLVSPRLADTTNLSPLFSVLIPGQLYGLEKFWAFLKYSKAKNLEIDPKLQVYLSNFKRLEDFRIDVSEAMWKTSI